MIKLKQKQKFSQKLIDFIYKKTLEGESIIYVSLLSIFLYKYFLIKYRFLQESQWWGQEKINKYQLEQLNKLLSHSYRHVPYYRKLFDEQGLKPEDIKSLGDLQKIPFLDKEIIRRNADDLKAKNYPAYKFRRITTGGTTGSPLKLYVEKNIFSLNYIIYNKMILREIGCNITNKSVFLRDTMISSHDNKKFWKYFYFRRHLILSSFHMSEENLPKYIKKIRKFKPKIIATFPSSITVIAKFMKRKNIGPIKSIKTVICMGEALYNWQRELLEEVFQCRVFTAYGHAESAVLACSCKKSDYYHFFPQYGIMELINRDGKPVRKEGEKGEIVATSIENFLFPLIRYKTGDMGIFTKEKCSCGRSYPLLKNIEGRWKQEFIVTGDNRLIPTVALHMHSDVFDNVKQFQFYQEKKGEVVFRIVKADTYKDEDTENIKNELYEKLGKNVDLKIEFMDEIPRTKRGKHKYLIQKIPIDFKSK